MNITSFFALSNKPTKFFRCIPPDDGRGAAMGRDSGIFPPKNNQHSSLDDNLAIDGGGRRNAIINRPLLDEEAVVPVSKIDTPKLKRPSAGRSS